mgnify:CR=1 FL=1
MKALVVDDDFSNRLLLQRFLSELGEVNIAVDGEEAVEAVRLALATREPYQLICLDILMPQMDGFQLAEFDADKLPEAELAAWLDRTDTRLKVPLLKTARRADPPAVETRYLWKPEVRKVPLGFLEVETNGVFLEPADLFLQARLLTPLDGSGSVFTVSGVCACDTSASGVLRYRYS